MAGSVNRAIIIGNLGRDPEVRVGRSGKKIANLSVATSRRYTDKATDEKMEATQWHRVVVFDDELARMIEKDARKGSTVIVTGEIQYRKYHDPKIDSDRWITDIVVMGFNSSVQVVSRDNIGQGQVYSPDPSDYGAKPVDPNKRAAGYGARTAPQRQDDAEVPF
jgi:single-strand DNA-binding protein